MKHLFKEVTLYNIRNNFLIGGYMSSKVMKVVRVTEDVHRRLANLGKIDDTYNDVIEHLLDDMRNILI